MRANRSQHSLTARTLATLCKTFDQGKFNIHQVNFMLNALENMGENVLVIMPQKYALESFNTSAGDRQYLDKDEMAIVEKYVA